MSTKTIFYLVESLNKLIETMYSIKQSLQVKL